MLVGHLLEARLEEVDFLRLGSVGGIVEMAVMKTNFFFAPCTAAAGGGGLGAVLGYAIFMAVEEVGGRSRA